MVCVMDWAERSCPEKRKISRKDFFTCEIMRQRKYTSELFTFTFISRMKKITVIGCGISGLSSALLLAREEFEVKIIAKDFPPNTTSDKAAAFWSPYYANGERVA